MKNEIKLREEAESMNKSDNEYNKVKWKRTGKDREVEEALLKWFEKARANNIPVSGPILTEKAGRLASELGKPDFKATEGWLNRWKARNSIVYKRAHGESHSANATSAAQWKSDSIPQLLQEFQPSNIYNADKTGLCYCATPDGSLVFRKSALQGSKKAMECITLLVCVNMTGTDKRKLLLIGKSKSPRCFKGLDQQQLPVTYRNNSAAWMTFVIFQDWLFAWDRELRSNNWHICLLVDNATSHPNSVELTNIRLVFLPPNTTSLVQPMDQGVIRNFKHFYCEQI